jgi:glycine oxidase
MNFAGRQEFDVLIVGGGVIGLSIARELMKNGVEQVAILEKNTLCGIEASAAAAGMLAPQVEANNSDDFFRLCQQSRDLYPDFSAQLFEETSVDIELEQTGTLYLALYDWDLIELEERFNWQRAADLPVDKLSAKEVLALEPNVSPSVLCALRFPFDWQVENRLLIEALRRASQNEGVQIIHGEVNKFIFREDRILGAATQTQEFYARVVVVASGAWTSLIDFPQSLKAQTEVVPILGQMISFAAQSPLFRHVIHTRRGYIVPRKNHRILVGATVEDRGFRKYNSSAGLNSLLETADEISTQFGKTKYEDCWSGLRPKSPDGLPLLGEFPANSGLYFATGHYRNGILLAPITAKLIVDQIAKNIGSPFLEIFNPGRFVNNS